ncbi:MAG: hypothetical protein ACJZ91_02375 [Alphaproteobacteria bacterium]
MTIFALSTVEGQSGVAIIRVSGPLSKKALKRLTGKEPKPRLTTLTKIKTLDKNIIDEGLVVYFPKRQSFTGEGGGGCGISHSWKHSNYRYTS